MREKDIEEYLRNQVRKIGGKAYKFTSPGNDGVPDRIVCLPGGRLVFVELKATGKAPRPLQLHRIAELESFGQRVEIIDSKERVDSFLKEMTKGGI